MIPQKYQNMDMAELTKEYSNARHKRKRAETAYLICCAYLQRNEGMHMMRNMQELQIATEYALTTQQVAREIGLRNLEAQSIIAKARCMAYQGKLEDTLAITDEAEAIVKEVDTEEITASWHWVRSRALKFSGRRGDAMQHEMIALELYTKLGKKEDIEITSYILSTSYREKGDYTNAFHYCSQALLLGLERKSNNTGSYYLELAVILSLLDNDIKSLEYLSLAEKFFVEQNLPAGLAAVYNAYGVYYMTKEKPKEALEPFLKAYSLAQQYGLSIFNRLLINLGDCYQFDGEPETALKYYQEALSLALSRNDMTVVSYVRRYMASVYIETGKLDEAEVLLKQCLEYYDNDFESGPEFYAIYKMLSYIAEMRNNHSEALTYYKSYHDIREKVRNQQQEQSMQELQHRLEVERAAREREELRAKTAELERSLDAKRGEMASLAVALSQKNEVIEKLHSRIKELSTSTQASHNERCKIMMHEIESMRQSGEEQWRHLQRQFESLDADFRLRLMKKYPNLTPIEIKICMLMRLNLATKDIANILWTSPRTVETHRYQIRKKLNLNKEENLFTILVEI